MKSNYWFDMDKDAVARAVSDVLTQSEMMLRVICPRKWYYRYALKLEKRGLVDFNLIYGSIMHRLLEELYKSKEKAYCHHPSDVPLMVDDAWIDDLMLSPKDQVELDLVKERAQIAFDIYRLYYHTKDARLFIKQVEDVMELKWKGLRLCCKIDMVAKPSFKDGIFIWDFKTAGSLNALAMDAWTFKFQFLFYCWMWWKVTKKKPMGIMINGLLKSALRPKIVDRKTKRREDQEEYLARVRQDMTDNRDKYFYRQRIPFGDGTLERFEHEMLSPHIEAFRNMNESLVMMQNTNQCYIYGSYCEYLSLCKDGTVAIGEYDQREAKHRELTDNDNE